MDGIESYLGKRIDQPLAWVRVFGTGGAGVGIAIVIKDYPLIYLPVGAALGFATLGFLGLLFGLSICLVCRFIGGLDIPIARPDLWAMNLRCSQCGWHTSPDGPYPRRYCLNWPEICPECEGEVIPIVPGCPRCKNPKLRGENIATDMLAQVRIPRSFKGYLYGYTRCSQCQCVYDRWGRDAGSQ